MTVVFKPLSAEHQYSPEWFLSATKLSVLSVLTVLPSFVHVIFGTGLPLALQWNVAIVPSITALPVGCVVMLGGTVMLPNKSSVSIRNQVRPDDSLLNNLTIVK